MSIGPRAVGSGTDVTQDLLDVVASLRCVFSISEKVAARGALVHCGNATAVLSEIHGGPMQKRFARRAVSTLTLFALVAAAFALSATMTTSTARAVSDHHSEHWLHFDRNRERPVQQVCGPVRRIELHRGIYRGAGYVSRKGWTHPRKNGARSDWVIRRTGWYLWKNCVEPAHAGDRDERGIYFKNRISLNEAFLTNSSDGLYRIGSWLRRYALCTPAACD